MNEIRTQKVLMTVIIEVEVDQLIKSKPKTIPAIYSRCFTAVSRLNT